jgi:hypothetical protein
MPTPRPDTSVIFRAVEKPGARISEKISASLSCASADTRPFSTARARTASAMIPPPSSETPIKTLALECRADRRMVAVERFPSAERTSAGSMPWSMLLRIRWISRSLGLIDDTQS